MKNIFILIMLSISIFGASGQYKVVLAKNESIGVNPKQALTVYGFAI